MHVSLISAIRLIVFLQCLGNHELAYKPSGLAPFLNVITFPIVAANIDFSQEDELNTFLIPKSWVLEISDKKIGVIGYITPCTMYTGYTGNVSISDEIGAIKLESEMLRSLGVKTIIALGHSGFKEDLKIAQNVPLIDLVIGGHTNTFLWNGPLDEYPEKSKGPYPVVVKQPNGKKVPVVQAYAYTKYIGRLTITINDEGEIVYWEGLPQLLNNSVPQDLEALNLLEKFRPKLQELDAITVGYSTSKLTGNLRKCRKKECILANLVTDAYVSYYKDNYNMSTIGLITSRSLYYTIVPKADGSLSILDFMTALPYTGKVYTFSLKGADIWKILEMGVNKNVFCSKSGFIHPSGLRYVYDLRRIQGEKVREVKVLCTDCPQPVYQNIILEKSYQVVVSELLYKGVDLFMQLDQFPIDVKEESKTELDIIFWYLNKISWVNYTTDGRIVRIS